MSTSVFISYNRADGRPALALADDLRARGLRVWIDQRSIPVTVPWMEEIEAGLRGAVLMVVVDSPQWRRSENCQAELRIAEHWMVPTVWLNPALDARYAADQVIDALGGQQPAERVRAELFARAGQWSSNGRPARDLVGGRALQQYRKLLQSFAPSAAVPADVRAFVRASAARQTRKKTLRSVGVAVAMVLVLGGIQAFVAFDRSQDRIDAAIQSFAQAGRFQDAYDSSPYEHLDLLTTTDSDGETVRWELARAFAVPLPDAVTPVGSTPVGAQLEKRRGARTAASPNRYFTAKLTEGGRQIDVTDRSGKLVRTIPLPFEAGPLAWSPDSAWLAVVDDSDVRLFDVFGGNDSVALRGAPAQIQAVVVETSGVSALVGDQVIHWPSPFGTPVSTVVAAWSAGAQLPGTDSALLVGRHGELAVVDLARGAVTKKASVGTPETAVTAHVAVTADASAALVTSVDSDREVSAIHVVRLSDWSVRSVSIGCVPTGVAVLEAREDVYVGCGRRGVGRLNLASGELEVKSIEQSAVSVGAGGDGLYAGTEFGYVTDVDPASLGVKARAGNGCPADVSPIAVTKDGEFVFTGGSSAANYGCAARVTFGQKTKADHLFFPWQTSNRAGALALDADNQLVAYGFDDGGVRVFNAVDFTTVAMRRPIPDPVRALVFSRDGNRLLVAGRSGSLQILDLSRDDGNNDNQRARAAEALRNGKALGLVR